MTAFFVKIADTEGSRKRRIYQMRVYFPRLMKSGRARRAEMYAKAADYSADFAAARGKFHIQHRKTLIYLPREINGFALPAGKPTMILTVVSANYADL